jgi:hypothetical protein
MSDIKTVTVTDSRIADLTPDLVYSVFNGAQQNTYQGFPFNSASNSSLTANIQIPSESIASDARVLLQSDLNLTINCANVPIGSSSFQYGLTDSLNSYPLQSLFTTASLTINNATSSTNYKDVMPFIKLLEDKATLDKSNSTSPDFINETWGNYADAVLSNSNPMGNLNDMAYDNARIPNGSYPATVVINRFVAGVFTDNSPISTGANNTWVIYLTFRGLTEPFLALSPFINNSFNRGALIGLNNIAMTMNIDSACAKVWTTGNCSAGALGWNSYITSIQLGTPASNSLGFTNSRLLFNFLTLSDLQYSQISTKSVTNYTSYDRYISPSSNSPVMTANTGGYNVTFQNIQLSQVPSLMVFALRVPMSSQNWCYTDGFLSVGQVSITFNNQSGLIASASQANIYNMSRANGSQQSYNSFRGQANAIQAGVAVTVPTLGSMIIVDCAKDLSLNGLLSNGSIGQFNVQIQLQGVLNQNPFQVQPEGILMCVNEGFCVNQLGNTQFFTSVLSRESVLEAKSEHPVNVVDESLYKRTVGGAMKPSQIGKYVRGLMSGSGKHKKSCDMEGGKQHSKSKLKHLLK